MAGVFILAGVLLICLPFHTSGVMSDYEPQSVSCQPAIITGWTNPDSVCGSPARERLIFGGGTALAMAIGATAALALRFRDDTKERRAFEASERRG
jgi:hypothetical protein